MPIERVFEHFYMANTAATARSSAHSQIIRFLFYGHTITRYTSSVASRSIVVYLIRSYRPAEAGKGSYIRAL